MKRLQIFTLLLFFSSLCSAQITMDSVKVYPDSIGIIDSIYVKYTSQNQKIKNFTYFTFQDGCSTAPCSIIFEGCSTLTSIQKDTVLTFGFWGLNTRLMKLYSIWDTSTTCSYPNNAISTDSYTYDNCFTSSLAETSGLVSKIRIFPNPANNFFSLKIENEISVERLELLGLQGNLVKTYSTANLKFDLSAITNGVYYLKLTTSEGVAVKKIIVRH